MHLIPLSRIQCSLGLEAHKETLMMRLPFLLGGMFTAMAIWLVYRGAQPRPIEVLAHKLEDAWANHHTRV